MAAPQINPQANIQAQPQVAPQQQLGQPQAQPKAPTKDTKANPEAAQQANIAYIVEQHLNSLPKEQQQYVAQFMTPELSIILGILLGQEAFEYFKKFADPKKQLTVVPRQQQQNTAPQPAAQQGQPNVQPQQPQQPQASPARTIMGR